MHSLNNSAMAKVKEIPAEVINFKELETPLDQLSEVDLESIHFWHLPKMLERIVPARRR